MDPIQKLTRNNTVDCLWPYILRMLKDKPAHAYVLREEVARRFGFMPGNVTAYRVLYSLKKDGLVTERMRGRKRVYMITGKGLAMLRGSVDFYRNRAKMLS